MLPVEHLRPVAGQGFPGLRHFLQLALMCGIARLDRQLAALSGMLGVIGYSDHGGASPNGRGNEFPYPTSGSIENETGERSDCLRAATRRAVRIDGPVS